MKTKERKIYLIVLVICSLIIGALMCYVDSLNKKIDSMQQPCVTCEIGNDLENYILDVVFETDLFEDINEEESEWLEYLIDEGEIGRYYIELVILCEKYYGNKE